MSFTAGKELHPEEAVATAMTTADAEGPLACIKIPGCWADTGITTSLSKSSVCYMLLFYFIIAA